MMDSALRDRVLAAMGDCADAAGEMARNGDPAAAQEFARAASLLAGCAAEFAVPEPAPVA